MFERRFLGQGISFSHRLYAGLSDTVPDEVDMEGTEVSLILRVVDIHENRIVYYNMPPLALLETPENIISGQTGTI